MDAQNAPVEIVPRSLAHIGRRDDEPQHSGGKEKGGDENQRGEQEQKAEAVVEDGADVGKVLFSIAASHQNLCA